MTRRRIALLVLPVAIVTACTSSSGGDNAVPSGMPTEAVGLEQLLQTAIPKIDSAAVVLDITAAGQEATGTGVITLSDGDLTALDVTETLPGGLGEAQFIVADGQTYAKLPPQYNSSGKPYLVVSTSSSNQVIRQIAPSLNSALSSNSLASLVPYTRAAESVDAVGSETIAGVETAHYKLAVSVAKLPSSLPEKDVLTANGIKTLPVDLYVDSSGRPVRIAERLDNQNEQLSTKLTLSDFNKPVTITAPPASQVGS